MRDHRLLRRQAGFSPSGQGSVEWAVAWPLWSDGSYSWYCNTIPTPDGGTHETGLRAALVKGIRGFADLVGQKKRQGHHRRRRRSSDRNEMMSVFIRDPQFQSQTKDRLTSPEAARLVEKARCATISTISSPTIWNAARRCSASSSSGWTSGCAARPSARSSARPRPRPQAAPARQADRLLERRSRRHRIVHRRGRQRRRIAKQARDRKTQAILPIRGKILNVASANSAKILANQEIADLIQALGCGTAKDCNADILRYDRIVIMTDADVDGAHIATLLMTFFFQEMPDIVRRGHLYLAQPPLYRLTAGTKSLYAMDDAAPRCDRGRLQGQEGRGRALQGPRRDEPDAAARNHDGSQDPHDAAHHPAPGI
jgi:topoisomerase-4 subunit B